MAPILLALAVAATPKLAIPEFTGVNLAPNEAAFFSNSLATALARGGLDVVTSRDLTTLLGLERQRQLMGCSEGGCVAELVGALGADGVVQGDVARLDDGYVVQLKILASHHGQTVALFSGRAAGQSDLTQVLEVAAVSLQNQLAQKWDRPDLVRAAPAPPPAPSRAWAYVVGGLGVVALGVGVALNLSADEVVKNLRSPRPGDTMASLAELRESGQRAEAAGFALVGVGSATLVAGAALFFILGREAPVVVSPTLGSSGAVLSLRGAR